MRALLVVNPQATTTSERTRDVLRRALETEVSLEVAHTSRRGHAMELARQATKDGIDLVVSLGGDGTVNEVVNGIMTGFVRNDSAVERITQTPILGVVPGGSTNVFARALGLSDDPVDATGALLEAIREKRFRRIGLGRVNDRWFTFCAGFGLDAEVVRRVERARTRGKVSTHGLYVRSAIAQYFRGTDHNGPNLVLNHLKSTSLLNESEQPVELAMAIVQNTSPWTYLGSRALSPAPAASFDTGLDVMGLRKLTILPTARTAIRLLTRGQGGGRGVFSAHDLSEFTLTASQPVAFQVDGDYLGERDSLKFFAIPKALKVAI